MASCEEPDLEALWKQKYNSYKVEVEAYLNSLVVATSSDISMLHIYEAIAEDDKVNSYLKSLYKEACFGNNKDVKSRIRNRISNFWRSLRFTLFMANCTEFTVINYYVDLLQF